MRAKLKRVKMRRKKPQPKRRVVFLRRPVRARPRPVRTNGIVYDQLPRGEGIAF